MASELDLYQKLDVELVSLADNFTNLVKAARAPEEEHQGREAREGRDKRAPGELLEVLAEKLLLCGHTCIHLVTELKKGAMLSDFNALIGNVRKLRNTLERDVATIDAELATMKMDVLDLLNEAEAAYYGSTEPGQPPVVSNSTAIAELHQLALESPATAAVAR